MSAKTFRKVMDTNVVGSFLCAREAFKQMKSAGGGRIINVGSIAAQAPRPDAVAYTASKSAVDGLTRSLALDGRPHNIAVGVVHPGNVRSDIMTAEEADRRIQETSDALEAGAETLATLIESRRDRP